MRTRTRPAADDLDGCRGLFNAALFSLVFWLVAGGLVVGGLAWAIDATVSGRWP